MDILENESVLSRKEVQLTRKLEELNASEASERTAEQKKDIVDKEVKLAQIRRDICACFKLVGDLVFYQHISSSVVVDILSRLTSDNQTQILSYHFFGKITLLFCGLGTKIFESESTAISDLLKRVLEWAETSVPHYQSREKLNGKTILDDLTELQKRKFRGVY